MDSQSFLRIVKEAFVPFLTREGFACEEPSISGRCYEASFCGADSVISVSYEPGDDALFVMVFKLKNGSPSSVDDRINTPRLADLNGRYMQLVTPEEFVANDLLFKGIRVEDRPERELLKAARELSLVLPRYLSELRNGRH
jgi:hypothetical protein